MGCELGRRHGIVRHLRASGAGRAILEHRNEPSIALRVTTGRLFAGLIQFTRSQIKRTRACLPSMRIGGVLKLSRLPSSL